MTIENQPLTLADLTTKQFCGHVVESFYKVGETIEAIAARVGMRPKDVEDIIRMDMKHLAEVEALALQAPANLSAAFDAQVVDAMNASDASPWARGFRCGYATGKAEASMAVGHLGNAVVARSEGLTREETR